MNGGEERRNERSKGWRDGAYFLLKLCNNLHRFPKQFLNLKSI